MAAAPDQHVDADITVKWDVWKVVERVGFATVLLILAGSYFFKQDESKQNYIQEEAAKNAAAIKEQAKLDREKEKMQAQFIQEKLITTLENNAAGSVETNSAMRDLSGNVKELVDKQDETIDVLKDVAHAVIKQVEQRDAETEASK